MFDKVFGKITREMRNFRGDFQRDFKRDLEKVCYFGVWLGSFHWSRASLGFRGVHNTPVPTIIKLTLSCLRVCESFLANNDQLLTKFPT